MINFVLKKLEQSSLQKKRVGLPLMSKVDIEVPDGRRILKSIALYE